MPSQSVGARCSAWTHNASAACLVRVRSALVTVSRISPAPDATRVTSEGELVEGGAVVAGRYGFDGSGQLRCPLVLPGPRRQRWAGFAPLMSYLSCSRPASGRRAGRKRCRFGVVDLAGDGVLERHGCIWGTSVTVTPQPFHSCSLKPGEPSTIRAIPAFSGTPGNCRRPRYGLDRLGGLLFDRRLFGRTAGSGGGGNVAVSLRSVRLTVQHSPATRSSTRVTLAPARAIKSITPEIPRSRLSAGAVARPSTVTLAPEDVRVACGRFVALGARVAGLVCCRRQRSLHQIRPGPLIGVSHPWHRLKSCACAGFACSGLGCSG